MAKHISNILDDINIVYTIHEQRIYRGRGKIVLLRRQADDIVIACSFPTVAQGVMYSIGEKVVLKSTSDETASRSLVNLTLFGC
jgi:hypothetical protein